MEKAAESASLTAAQKQKGYGGDYFNKRSSVKNFSIGEQVVLLIPDSSNKIYARWTGPGEIIQHHPPHSYKVKLPDGTVRHVHVNKIRKYHPRALAVGVILKVTTNSRNPSYSNLSRSTSERVLHEINLNHLKERTHRIRLKPNIERKKPFVYRIPESLKIKVDEQIEELVRLDLIEESDAEIAYPIVCVNKKDGTLRLCVDFRALNSEVCLMIFRWKMQWSSYILLEEPISSQQLNFTVNLKKCAFGKAQIKYLGHIIGSGKHEPDPEKTAVINNLPVPKTKKELRSVLGLCNYYLEAPSLYSPVPDKPYTIHSDASQIGIAACLSQKCGDKCYPIAYASQKIKREAGVNPLLSIGWWYLSSVSPKRHCCRVSAADKECRVDPLDPRPDAVALYSGCTLGKRRAWF
ncbi:retrovirus-related Pol polyprotein from transposon 17.6 [Trichonephila clavipes]|uniref:Retrovirus-related Pol polyprotein from transposon 17.6 n=1 Tax=Trichonephila clavipes TaxID=2585209 RepID=A0A8X6SEE7_TRICX|nr:retrovirus-related Pol polyprotein from transposon 17.6 [Trichonephila clavipes]